jgi:uncharacterized protein YndB with AHSA1/START domain
MLPNILIGLAILIVVFVIIVALRPADFRITRTATITAPPPVVFALVNDFHRWRDWSPWENIDPALKRTYDGPPAGEGAIYSWVGNNQVGEGRMTITESRPSDRILIKLEFLKPFAATNTTEFTFDPQGDQTLVNWTMSGKNNFMTKAFGLVMNMDKMIGGQFEQGLAQMKTVAEAAPKP